MGQAMELEAMARNRLIAASGPGKELGTSLLIYSLQNGEHKMSKAWAEKQKGRCNEKSIWKACQVQWLKIPAMSYSNWV